MRSAGTPARRTGAPPIAARHYMGVPGRRKAHVLSHCMSGGGRGVGPGLRVWQQVGPGDIGMGGSWEARRLRCFPRLSPEIMGVGPGPEGPAGIRSAEGTLAWEGPGRCEARRALPRCGQRSWWWELGLRGRRQVIRGAIVTKGSRQLRSPRCFFPKHREMVGAGAEPRVGSESADGHWHGRVRACVKPEVFVTLGRLIIGWLPGPKWMAAGHQRGHLHGQVPAGGKPEVLSPFVLGVHGGGGWT